MILCQDKEELSYTCVINNHPLGGVFRLPLAIMDHKEKPRAPYGRPDKSKKWG